MVALALVAAITNGVVAVVFLRLIKHRRGGNTNQRYSCEHIITVKMALSPPLPPGQAGGDYEEPLSPGQPLVSHSPQCLLPPRPRLRMTLSMMSYPETSDIASY